MGEVRVSARDSLVQVRAGDDIVVELPENPSTGYLWEITGIEGLEVTGDDHASAPTGLVGAGGSRVLRLRAEKAGEGRLELVYRRSWEAEGENAGQYALRVTVV
ncbi:protease inhibitor I42 family protein [Streptomyces acidiscabies]|uniref:Protease inhibitor I42 family protein n=1 Tax=Streptomyces acidiscabies TaxID=42234 RepID=A0AAP6BLJ0_9ACTN|nr:protease inhibitor I42 family protein [Streptomyces acidiscabies]MBP5941223.1 protease inhibitor I42 family protein [Streptomyces sp. LBUM 1476]MBZ3912554.1 protease inhibitor I42 family protein [Streptomyces acidiscabies]MDX2966972.1 protease inhibitor I42 family protein [Streptomyces acidiscabies]MDX3025923.1 protease inhibitor I42 family protein [Streptomyces acidiscabies]MDX3796905.1 protease inhibitor I42 family protein [Streptomyces acidiscabies]